MGWKNTMTKLTIVAGKGLLAGLAAWGAADLPARAGEAVLNPPPGREYVYKISGGQARKLEVYFPPDHEPATASVPGIIFFHGGAWASGDLSLFRPAAYYFASRGLVAVTANYRMLGRDEVNALPKGESRKRVCITDAKSALRWFRQHARELGVDPARIIAGGGSAGAHVAVLANLNPGLDDPADPPGVDPSAMAYVLFNPAFEAADRFDPDVNVLQHLDAPLAPAIVFFGTADPWKAGWNVLHRELIRRQWTNVELWTAAGQGHAFYRTAPWLTATLIEADRFLGRLGLIEGEPSLAPPATGEKLYPGTLHEDDTTRAQHE